MNEGRKSHLRNVHANHIRSRVIDKGEIQVGHSRAFGDVDRGGSHTPLLPSRLCRVFCEGEGRGSRGD